MNDRLSLVERQLVEEILKQHSQAYPSLADQLDRLRVISREPTGVGAYIHFSVLGPVEAETINIELGFEGAIQVDGVPWGLGCVMLVRNILTWFEDLSIVHREGTGNARSPKFLAILGATVRDLKDLVPPFETKMWRVAVRGEDIPQFALAAALRRIKVDIIEDKPFNHARMGLIKAYHMRKNRRRGDNLMTDELKPHLNEDHPHGAYQCGRLMAVLAQLQRSALGDVGAGLVQRYYAAASTTPSLVLGRITRLSQFHLNKLDPGLAHWYETLIARIWGRLQDALPRTLDLEEQSLFALGYYQQIAHMRSKKADKVANERGEENGLIRQVRKWSGVERRFSA
jgi:hypothetical protein